jgi:hypothetical protein
MIGIQELTKALDASLSVCDLEDGQSSNVSLPQEQRYCDMLIPCPMKPDWAATSGEVMDWI